MLVLSRKAGERIQIGDDIFLTIVRIGPSNVRIGVEAPRDLQIVRGELTQTAGTVPDENAELQPSARASA